MTAKAQRRQHAKATRSKQEKTPLQKNARALKKSAERLIALDFSNVPCNRVTQISIGWLRSACYQMILIADTTSRGNGHLVAPNRRLFAEIGIRALWLYSLPQEQRADAVNEMLTNEREKEHGRAGHMRDMGVDYNPDFSEMDAIDLSNKLPKTFKRQAKVLTEAAKGTRKGSFGLFLAWSRDSTYAHATGILGGAYAPISPADTIGVGIPDTPAADLGIYKEGLLLIAAVTARLLIEEGAEETPITDKILTACFGS